MSCSEKWLLSTCVCIEFQSKFLFYIFSTICQKKKKKIMNILKECRSLNGWSMFAIGFSVFFTFSIASPQSYSGSGQGGGGNSMEIVLSINKGFPLKISEDYFYDNSFWIREMGERGPEVIETVDVLLGTPDIACLFVNTRADGGAAFASRTVYTPDTRIRYPGATATMTEPFPSPNYLVLYRLPRDRDPSVIMAVLTSEGGAGGAAAAAAAADPSSDRAPGFEMHVKSLALRDTRGGYAIDRFALPITVRKAALVHAAHPRSQVQLISRDKSESFEITLQDQLLDPFEDAMFMVSGIAPPSGPMLSPEQLDRL